MSHTTASRLAAIVALALLGGCGAAAAPGPRVVEGIASITPRPEDAYVDTPARPGCQLGAPGEPPLVCQFGEDDADHTVMIVGDSKVVQWRPGIEAVAQERGWRILQVTKSACAFADVMTVYEHAPWTDCRKWGQATLDLILKVHPDLVITSQRRTQAMVDDDPAEVSGSAMVVGLVSYWTTLEHAGIDVAVLLDNPGPPRDVDVPACLGENRDNFGACAFDTAAGIGRSATPVQRTAAAQVPGVQVLDLNRLVCPQAECQPVQDGVLVYRQGTHVTATFAKKLAPAISALLR